MKELSLNILDITENSVKAGASLTEISIAETKDRLTIAIKDDGCGMSEETVKAVVDPFYTTRTTRKVGMGVPLFKMAAEQTGGRLEILSSTGEDHGTMVTAYFHKDHLDFTPLGDVISTIITLIQGHPDTDFLFIHLIDEKEIRLDTRELRTVLDGVPLSTYDVLEWIRGYLEEQYS